MTDGESESGNVRRRARTAARLYAVQALFQVEQSGRTVDTVASEFLTHRFGAEIDDGVEMADGDPDLFRLLAEEAVNRQAGIDQMADRALSEDWPIDRIDPTIRAILRAAGAELLCADTPPKAVISEFVDIASSFFPEGRQAKFVNGVLDAMAREARPGAL